MSNPKNEHICLTCQKIYCEQTSSAIDTQLYCSRKCETEKITNFIDKKD
jgi:hypothetical protein